MLKFAVSLLHTVAEVRNELKVNFNMRIGLHIGKFVGGVIGTKKLRYDIWGIDVYLTNTVFGVTCTAM